jgi:hypothetical protein
VTRVLEIGWWTNHGPVNPPHSLLHTFPLHTHTQEMRTSAVMFSDTLQRYNIRVSQDQKWEHQLWCSVTHYKGTTYGCLRTRMQAKMGYKISKQITGKCVTVQVFGNDSNKWKFDSEGN